MLQVGLSRVLSTTLPLHSGTREAKASMPDMANSTGFAIVTVSVQIVFSIR